MAQEFDPYHTWLGIPPSERPADHYRLLGVARFEEDPDVISNAADARMAFVRTFQAGPRGAHSQQILNELAAARTTLLNEPRKSVYDEQLRVAIAAKANGSAVLPVAVATPGPEQQIPAAPEVFADLLPSIVTKPVIAARRPVHRKAVSLPMVIAGIAVPVALLGLVVGYLVTRGHNNEPVVIKPGPSPDPPSPNVPVRVPKPETRPVTDPPALSPEKPKQPIDNKPPVVPVGRQSKEIDLLALIETPRDVPLGEVIREADALSIRRRGGFTCAVVPYDLPATYELELRVTPRDGEGLLIGLPISGRRCMLTIDGFLNEPPTKETRTALETIDGRRPQDAGYSGTPHFGKLLTPGVESRLSLRVTENSVKLSCDGKSVIDWSGDPSRLGIYGLFDQGSPRRMFVGSWAAQYDIGSLTLKPLDSPPGTVKASSPINLLARVKLPRDRLAGDAVREKGMLSLRTPNTGGFSCVRILQEAPANYQLDVRVTPRKAADGFIVGLSVAGRSCMVGFDGYRMGSPPRSALEAIDGLRPFEQGFPGQVHVGQLFQDGVESQVSVRVVGGSVQVVFDGKQVLAWSGDPQKLSVHPIFGEHKERSLFLGSWNATYDVASVTLQPLDGPALVASTGGVKKPNVARSTPSIVASTGDNRPWRWARANSGASGLALAANGKRAIMFHPGSAPWNIQSIDVATGELGSRLDGQGSIENVQTIAVGPDSSPLVAFSVAENNGLTTLVKSLSGERKRERQYAKQRPDMRYAFSADGKYLAASVGARVNLMNVDTGRTLAHIDPPADVRFAVVERLLDDNEMLLALYSVKTNAGTEENRAVAYDWKTRRVKRSRDFTTREADVRGVHFQGDDLWAWGRGNQRAMVIAYPATGAPEQHLLLASVESVTDIHIPSQTALIVDANPPRLIARNFAAGGKQAQVEYSGRLADARFVEDGKAILCQPGAPTDLVLLWEAAPLLDARRVVAPTVKEVGLDDPKLQAEAKAVQRSEVKLSRPTPASPGGPDSPDRQEAKAELARLRVPLPGGQVKFLNIQNGFTEEHARLLLALPELEGLHLQNVQPSLKMFEYLAQLPVLNNLTVASSPVTDDHLSGLAKARALQLLNLHGTQIEGDGIKHLVNLPLRNLSVAPKPPNLAGWQAIGRLKLLESCGNFGEEQADEKLAAVSDLPNLKYLNLNDVRLTGEGLKPVEKMTSLVHLDLPQIDLRDEDLRPLQNLTNLQVLSLPNSVGDGSVEFLPATKLTRLRVGAGFSDAGLLAIAKKYPDLQICDLMHCSRVTEKGLGHLADHARLHTLVLPNAASVAMCEQVARMPSLKRLEHSFQSLSAAHLAPLRDHPALEDFQLTKIDDNALAELSQIRTLKALHLNEPLVKAKGLEQLVKASKLERMTLLNSATLREYGAAEAAALEKLTQLKQLNIFGTSLDQAAIEKIKQSLPKTTVQIVR